MGGGQGCHSTFFNAHTVPHKRILQLQMSIMTRPRNPGLDQCTCFSLKVLLKLEQASESHGSLVNTQMAGPHPRGANSVCLGWALRVCTSAEFPDVDADAAGPGTTLCEPLLYKKGERLVTALACVDPLGDTTVYTLSTCFVSFWDIFTWSCLPVPTCFPVKPNYI